jgi:hypothetical protein
MHGAGQTPHGARPNREESLARKGDPEPEFRWRTRRLGTSQPPGRSLEPASNGGPRGMITPVARRDRTRLTDSAATTRGLHRKMQAASVCRRCFCGHGYRACPGRAACAKFSCLPHDQDAHSHRSLWPLGISSRRRQFSGVVADIARSQNTVSKDTDIRISLRHRL